MTIITDLSEVLIHGLYGIEKLVERNYGKDVAKDFLDCHRIQERESGLFLSLLRGEIEENEYWENFCKMRHFPFGVNEIWELFSENLAIRIPGTLDVYQGITQHPLSLIESNVMVDGMPRFILASDHVSERISQLWSLHRDFFEMFEMQVWSCNVGKIKRDPGFFKNLMKDAELSPDEIIFIDDSPVNINAARNDAGIRGIVFENAKQLKFVLEEYGFKFADDYENYNFEVTE